MQFSSVCVCVTVFKVLTLFGVFSFIPLVLKQKVFCCLMDSCVLFSRLVRFILFTFFWGGATSAIQRTFFFLESFFFFFFAFYRLSNFALIWFGFTTSGAGSSAGSSSASKVAAWDGCVPVVESCVPVFMPLHAVRKVHATPFSCSPEICISLLRALHGVVRMPVMIKLLMSCVFP